MSVMPDRSAVATAKLEGAPTAAITGTPTINAFCPSSKLARPPTNRSDLLIGMRAGRPVMDKTGLTGIYSFKLDWVNDASAAGELPSLAVALQEQLGLKLKAAKGTGGCIVVDHVERPSAN
jgi:uncharacterized protein (TIGR03435 family)